LKWIFTKYLTKNLRLNVQYFNTKIPHVTQHNDTQHNDTQHTDTKSWQSQHYTLSIMKIIIAIVMLSISILSIVIGNAVAVMLSITAPARKLNENHTIFHSLDTVRLLLKHHSKILVRHFVTKFQQFLLFSEFDKLQQHSKYFYQITKRVKRVKQEVLHSVTEKMKSCEYDHRFCTEASSASQMLYIRSLTLSIRMLRISFLWLIHWCTLLIGLSWRWEK
jgi:hypothetical protein